MSHRILMCPEDGNIYIQTSTGMIVIQMTMKDLDNLEKYLGFIKKKITLKKNPKTEDEKEFKRVYHRIYNRERAIIEKLSGHS